jgi:hypothetical protein
MLGGETIVVNGSAVPLGGWLLLLSRLLIVWHPIIVGLVAVSSLNSVSILWWPVRLILLARVLVTAFGVAAGFALRGRHRGAVRMAKAALLLAAATDLFVYSTPYFPHNRAPGETPIWIVASTTYYAAWLLYLMRSKRVRDLFS